MSNDVPSQSEAADTPTLVEKVALYSFHPFTDTELATIAKACEKDGYDNGGNEDFIAAAPKPHFTDSDGKVESVIAYHRDLVKSPTDGPDGPVSYDPNYFIVVKSPQWKKEGVLVVTLNEFELKEVPDDGEAVKRGWDAWMFTAKSSGLTILNLQIANMGWTEYTTWDDDQPEGQEVDGRDGKTWYEMHPEEPDEGERQQD
ncbi:hypothetical protein D9758_012864 [Tetrapyrgos nigripes]|uniref:Uncharacterized protein n=1 Tax=Tetrapyrgos nigripes TaxID=182062 RepID=A0A8H5CBI8_9AGAR|nr:hypothetical protein D9758_012864 [Tetrapyrgos nigripes]